MKIGIALTVLLQSQIAFSDDILVVLSDKDSMSLQDGKKYDTGFYLNELIEPVMRFIKAGHTVTYATPSGLAPTMDPNSDNIQFFNNDEGYYQENKKFLNKLKITDPSASPVISFSRVEQIGVAEFEALYIPGGHAPVEDLAANDQLGSILKAFHESKKPTGLTCHGPIALLSAMSNNNEFVGDLAKGKSTVEAEDWLYSGYKMTVFSNSEEEAATKFYLNGGEMYYFPQDALVKAGGSYKSGENWAPNMITDRELITGQNPASAVAVADEILKRL